MALDHRPPWLLSAALLGSILLGSCGGHHRSGMTITEGPALGASEPERGVPPHVAPRLDQAGLQQLDDFIVTTMIELDIPGLALGIVSGDDVVHLRGFGVSDDRSRPVTPDTPFLTASVTQLITATAAMQLVEDGLLDLDAPVRRYLPWFTTASGDSARITPRHLLNQQSGFSERVGLDNIFNGTTSETALEDNVRRLKDVNLANPLGTYEYSNVNHDILGLIVQTLSNQSFEDYASANVLAPLEMRHSHLEQDAARADGLATGFYRWFGTPAPTAMPFSRSLVPSMMLMSTVEDLSHLLIAQLNGGSYAGARVLTTDSMREFQTPELYGLYSGTAMGWQVRPLWDAPIQLGSEEDALEYRIPTILENEGRYPTFGSYIAVVPEGRWGLVVLVNTNDLLTGREAFPYENVLRMVLGEEPQPLANTVPILARNLRWVLTTVLMLLVAAAGLAGVRIRRWRSSPMGLPEGMGAFVRYVLFPTGVDLIVLYVLVFVLPARYDVSAVVALRGAPDVGVLVALIVLLTVGWGTTRTVLTLTTLYRKREGPGLTFRVAR